MSPAVSCFLSVGKDTGRVAPQIPNLAAELPWLPFRCGRWFCSWHPLQGYWQQWCFKLGSSMVQLPISLPRRRCCNTESVRVRFSCVSVESPEQVSRIFPVVLVLWQQSHGLGKMGNVVLSLTSIPFQSGHAKRWHVSSSRLRCGLATRWRLCHEEMTFIVSGASYATVCRACGSTLIFLLIFPFQWSFLYPWKSVLGVGKQ